MLTYPSFRLCGIAVMGLSLFGGLGIIGCGAGRRTYPVSGTVTLDGMPLESGTVYLFPRDPNVSADAGVIKDGAFHFEAKEGKMRVEIRASRVVPGKKSPMGSPMKEEYLPARYNRQSTLEAEVTAKGTNVFTFELSTKQE